MKLINPDVIILPQSKGLEGVYKQIEIAGRTAYKSEDKITEDSAKQFVDMLISRGHTAPLEHGTVYLRGIAVRKDYMSYHIDDYKNNPYSRVYLVRDLEDPDVIEFYITSNFRVLYENNWLEDLQYLSEPTKFHEKRITARFICSRSISHELVRHRTFSFVQESSRYCNYSKDRFNNKLTFIIPSWLNLSEEEANMFLPLAHSGMELNEEGKNHLIFFNGLDVAEQTYLLMLRRGFKPQEAREVLPNALKTEVVMTGFVSDWKHFFRLRTTLLAETGKPHPDMSYLADILYTEFVKRKFIEPLV